MRGIKELRLSARILPRARFRELTSAGSKSGSAIAFIMLVIVFPSCAAEQEAHITFPEQKAVIDPAQIPILEREALQGSSDAAHKLATYSSVIRLDSKAAIYWSEIRVENGDRNARYDLGTMLSSDDNPLSHLRARFWLKQVEMDAPPELRDLAKYALKSLDDREEYERARKR